MGLSSSKEIKPPSKPGIRIDTSLATYSPQAVEIMQQRAAEAIRAAEEKAAEFAETASSIPFTIFKWVSGTILVLGILGVVIALIHDGIVGPSGNRWILPYTPPPTTLIQGLYIYSAKYGSGGTTTDVKPYLSSLIQNGNTLPGFVVSPAAVGLKTNPVQGVKNTLYVTWYVGGQNYQQTTVNEGSSFPTLPTSSVSSTQAPTSSFFSSIFSSGSSGSLIPPQDATTSTSISASKAPISTEGDGAYSMQWWMYVKDWNYGFGKKKAIIKRPDTTNPGVLNPSISLHPTDNSLQVSVSVFPSSEGSTGKTEPAPAGHSASTDDVFVCEVPNIPLQTWFSVSVSVFGRNLDIYIDGKLVKSCFLPGVPKPAVGDIQVTPEGGFSGQICDFTHYSRMLSPADALNFWSSGSSCQSSGAGSLPVSKTSGYAVKFGVYDSAGKEVQEYAF